MRGRPLRGSKRLVISTPIFLNRGAGAGSGDDDYEYRRNKDMEGSRYIFATAPTLDAGTHSLTAILKHYVPKGEASPVDGSISGGFNRFIWEYSLVYSEARTRVAGDSAFIGGWDTSLYRGGPAGLRLTPPTLGDRTTVTWGLGSTFELRKYRPTVRSGTRPPFYLASGGIGDFRFESGSIPLVPFTGTWLQTHSW